MTASDRLTKSILLDCQDDHVGLWSIVRDVHDLLPSAADREVKQTTLGAVSSLLAAGRIVAGFPAENGIGFRSWDLPRERAVERIESEWDALGRDPDIGEIVWFSAPGGAQEEKESRRRVTKS